MKTCKIDGCDRRADTIGICATHYRRHRLYGDPLGGGAFRARPGQPLAFLERAKASKTDDCLIWPFARNSAGYGHLEIDGRLTLAHRIICADANGPAPDDKSEAAHLCGNGHLGCINRRHLQWKDRKGNSDDKIIHGTLLSGETCPASKLTDKDVISIRAMGGSLSQSKIAAKFGITQTNVGYILRRATWKHLPEFHEPERVA